MTGSNHQHTQVALSRLDKSMAALERIRDRILTKRDAYPQNSEKWQRQTMELNAVLSKLQEFQAEKDVVFHPELYSDEQLPYMACFHGVVSALEAFVSSMSPVTSDFLEYTDPKTGNTPLLVACAQGHVECAKILIAVGANVDARNKAGSTALHCACEHGQMDVVAFLLDVPYMNPYTLDRRHHSPLQIARMACLDHDAWTRFKECARLLEERCCIFRSWVYESTATMGISKFLGPSPWKLRYAIVLRTAPSSSQVEICLFNAKEHARCPPVPTSTLLYALGDPFQSSPTCTKHSRQHGFSFQARRDGATVTVEFAAASADGFEAWTTFFSVYSSLAMLDDARLLRRHNDFASEDVETEEAAKEPRVATGPAADWGPPRTALHRAPLSPSAPKLPSKEFFPSSPPPDAPSAPSLALSPSAQVAFAVGHGGFSGLDKQSKKLSKKGTFDLNTTRTMPTIPATRPPEASSTSAHSTAEATHDNEGNPHCRECIVCFDGPQNAVCVPCGHNAMCMGCAENVLVTAPSCPVCRQHVRELVRIYKG